MRRLSCELVIEDKELRDDFNDGGHVRTVPWAEVIRETFMSHVQCFSLPVRGMSSGDCWTRPGCSTVGPESGHNFERVCYSLCGQCLPSILLHVARC